MILPGMQDYKSLSQQIGLMLSAQDTCTLSLQMLKNQYTDFKKTWYEHHATRKLHLYFSHFMLGSYNDVMTTNCQA